MKFVYCGYDFMLGAVRRLLEDGHELTGVFTFECDNVFNFNIETLALAKKHGVLSVLSPPQDIHIEAFIDKGAQCFLAGGYPYKIPPIDELRAYGINIHPSLLPAGRGLMPTPHIIMHYPKAAGISVHKLTSIFDDGDILYQEVLPLSPRETVETYSARIALRAPDILSSIMADLPPHWQNARAQNRNKASTFPPPDDAMRTLDWSSPVETIDKTARAFGRFGCLAHFDGQIFVVYALDVWKEKHRLSPGTIALRQAREIIIAARDGFVCLKDFQIARS